VQGGTLEGPVGDDGIPEIGLPVGTSPGREAPKIEVSWWRAWSWDVPMLLKGDAGAGCRRDGHCDTCREELNSVNNPV
jgi:hypothetical protein